MRFDMVFFGHRAISVRMRIFAASFQGKILQHGRFAVRGLQLPRGVPEPARAFENDGQTLADDLEPIVIVHLAQDFALPQADIELVVAHYVTDSGSLSPSPTLNGGGTRNKASRAGQRSPCRGPHVQKSGAESIRSSPQDVTFFLTIQNFQET